MKTNQKKQTKKQKEIEITVDYNLRDYDPALMIQLGQDCFDLFKKKTGAIIDIKMRAN